jgi:hypothetical protein
MPIVPGTGFPYPAWRPETLIILLALSGLVIGALARLR